MQIDRKLTIEMLEAVLVKREIYREGLLRLYGDSELAPRHLDRLIEWGAIATASRGQLLRPRDGHPLVKAMKEQIAATRRLNRVVDHLNALSDDDMTPEEEFDAYTRPELEAALDRIRAEEAADRLAGPVQHRARPRAVR